MLSPSDEELLQGLLARDTRAMTLFYQRYRAALYQLVLRVVRNPQTAEDVLQEAMLKVWAAVASYDASRGRLFTWAATICGNAAIDYLRTGAARATARTDSVEDTAVWQHAAAGGFRPEHIGVRELVAGLRPEYRQVMDLIYLQGYTQQEVADQLGIPLGTIKTWAVRGKRALARLLH